MSKKAPIAMIRKLFNRRLFIVLLIIAQICWTAAMLFRSYQLAWLQSLLTLFSVVTALHLMLRNDKSAFKLSLVVLILPPVSGNTIAPAAADGPPAIHWAALWVPHSWHGWRLC